MTRRRVRLAVLVGGWAAAVAVFGVLQMRPAVTVIAAIVVAVAASLWWVLDVSDVAARTDWRATADTSGSAAGSDARVSALRRQILDARIFVDDTSLSRALVSLVDDVLQRRGIDRSREPDRAAVLLGPQLGSFIADPSDRALLGDPRRLDLVVRRLEQLSADALEPPIAHDRRPAGPTAAHPAPKERR